MASSEIYGIKIRVMTNDKMKVIAAAAAALGRGLLRLCAADAGDGRMEITAYAAAESAEALRRAASGIPGAAGAEVWSADGDPVLASSRGSADLLVLPTDVLLYMSESMGDMLGPAGAALSFHVAYKIGERLMDVMSSAREPRELGEAALYVERALDVYGLGDAEIEVSDEVPVRVRAVVRPRERGFNEASAGMVRGLVAGMLSRALGRPLSVGSQTVESGVARFELVEGGGAPWRAVPGRRDFLWKIDERLIIVLRKPKNISVSILLSVNRNGREGARDKGRARGGAHSDIGRADPRAGGPAPLRCDRGRPERKQHLS
ncbi:MAG: hypothetical protein RXP91_02635 [Nitrososphaeria archaeon]